MEVSEAIRLIQAKVPSEKSIWADLGAGTGIFTQALQEILPEESTIYALDKSPMVLYRLPQLPHKKLIVIDGDFTKTMELPKLDGVVLANALHYTQDHTSTLQNILHYLRPQGTLIIVEYEQNQPNPPWVPYPISFQRLGKVAESLNLTPPVQFAQTPSRYGYTHIYAAQLINTIS